jgi:hypothetical protein
LIAFMRIVANRLGADELLTPREVLRDFVSILNFIRQNPGVGFASMIGEGNFTAPSASSAEAEDDESGGSDSGGGRGGIGDGVGSDGGNRVRGIGGGGIGDGISNGSGSGSDSGGIDDEAVEYTI